MLVTAGLLTEPGQSQWQSRQHPALIQLSMKWYCALLWLCSVGSRCLGNGHICMFRLNVYKPHWYRNLRLPELGSCCTHTLLYIKLMSNGMMQYLQNLATSQQIAYVHCSNSQMCLTPVLPIYAYQHLTSHVMTWLAVTRFTSFISLSFEQPLWNQP